MLLRMDFTNLHFGGAVVMDSPSQTVAMAQTEHSTAGGNPNGHAQGEKLHWLPLSAFLSRKNGPCGCNLMVGCFVEISCTKKWDIDLVTIC
jgi:hypothetical protein